MMQYEFIDFLREKLNKVVRGDYNHFGSPEKIVQKWQMILKGFLDRNYISIDDDTMKYFCVMCELHKAYNEYYIRDPKNQIDTVKFIEETIQKYKNSITSKRVGIVRKVYNFQNGLIEYELEDGTYVPTNESVKPPITDFKFFTDEYLKIVNVQSYRDKVIDKLL